MAPEAGRCPTLMEQGGVPAVSPLRGDLSLPGDAEVTNRNLLNTLFKFKQGAPLKQFIFDKTREEKNFYSLAEILTVLKDVISSEKMFDEKNPSVIICSKPMEQALDQKALHVTEVRDLVLVQLEKLADQTLRERSLPRPSPGLQTGVTTVQRVVRSASIATNVQTNKDTKYRLKPLFLAVAHSVEGADTKKAIFTYEEVTLMLSKYILSKKDTLFDPRNIKLAIVEDDPLGLAFGVKAFHRCQVNALLRSQLIPVHPDARPAELTLPGTNSAPGISISTSSSSIPAFPALVKAASTPASLRQGRKRSNSVEQQGEDHMQKHTRRSGQCSVIVRRSGASEDSDTETIYSEQGYETIQAAEEEMEDATTDSDAPMAGEEFDVEYDIDSGEEEERPPQAHGKGREFSSANDTDTEVDEQFRAKGPVSGPVESVYWADSEEEKGEAGQAEELFISEEKKWSCISCQQPSRPMIRYCARCWEARKSWVPERPRKGKGKKVCKKTPVVGLASLVEVVEVGGTDDTDGAADADRPRSDTMSSQDSGIGSQDMEMLELGGETELVLQSRSADFVRAQSLDITCKSSSSSSSMDTTDLSELGSASDMRVPATATDLCMLCCSRPKNATFIHGKLGHQVCCYPCAKKQWKVCPKCPICNRKVERIIKVIQA